MVTWKVGALLAAHKLTPDRLAQAVNGRPNRNTVYAIANGAATRVDLASLGRLVSALRELTGADVNVGDLLEVVEERDETALWDAASAADLGHALDDLEADEDPEAVRAWLAAFEQAAR